MDEKQKLLVAIAVAVILAAGLAYLIYRERNVATETQTSIDTCRTAIKAAEAKIAEIPKLEAERQELIKFVEDYVRILPDEKEVEALLETLSELKDQAGLAPDAIESFQFAQDSTSMRGRPTSANFQRYIRKVDLKANFFQFVTFVNLLERYKRFIQVDSFGIKPKTEGGGSALDIVMQLSTFTYTRKKK
jgi:Tfp pilus assembly protein PilO